MDDLDDLGNSSATDRSATASDEGRGGSRAGSNVHHLDDLRSTLNQRSADQRGGLLQDLDYLHGGWGGARNGGQVDGSGGGSMTATAASGDDLHLEDLGSSLVAVAAAIAGTSGVATGVSAALLVDDLDDLDRATGTVSAMVAATTASLVAAASVTTAAAQAESALQVGSTTAATSAAATASEETQEASVGHSEQSTHANEDLEGDEAF